MRNEDTGYPDTAYSVAMRIPLLDDAGFLVSVSCVSRVVCRGGVARAVVRRAVGCSSLAAVLGERDYRMIFYICDPKEFTMI
jgi:hypothetical protein